MLACAIITGIVRALRLPRNRFGNGLASIILGLPIAALAICLNWAVHFKMSPREWFEVLAASFFAGLSLNVIKTLHDQVLPPNIDMIAGFVLDDTGHQNIIGWLSRNFSWWRQILASAVVAVLSIATLARFALAVPRLSGDLGLYFATVIGMFAVGHGAYCALVIPTLAAELSKQHLNIFAYAPATSPEIQIASGVFGRLSLGNSAVVTALMLGLFILNPWRRQDAFPIAMLWLITAWAIVSYSFFIPNYFLARAAALAKFRRLKELEAAVHTYDDRLAELSIDELNRLTQLLQLHERVGRSRTSPLDFESWRTYVSSLVLPTLSFIAGMLFK